MKTYLVNVLHGIPLAIGALLCMFSVLNALNGKTMGGSVQCYWAC